MFTEPQSHKLFITLQQGVIRKMQTARYTEYGIHRYKEQHTYPEVRDHYSFDTFDKLLPDCPFSRRHGHEIQESGAEEQTVHIENLIEVQQP